MRRQRNLLGPQGMGGMVSLWGASSLIRQIQAFTITLSAAPSGTATITAVPLGDSILFYDHYDTDYSVSANTSFTARVTFTNTTTITANDTGAATGGVTTIVRGRVVTFAPGVIRSIQRGSLSFSAQSGTVTITEVNTDKSFLVDNGFTTNSSDERLQATWAITNGTTLTAQTRLAPVGKECNYQCVELF